MNWQDYIISDPKVLLGKPIVKGTRLSVEFLLSLLAEGWSENNLLDNYPTLTHEGLKAIFAFTIDCIRDEAIYPSNLQKAG